MFKFQPKLSLLRLCFSYKISKDNFFWHFLCWIKFIVWFNIFHFRLSKIIDLIALLDLYLYKSCGYGPLTNLNTKQPPMFWFFGSFGPSVHCWLGQRWRDTLSEVPRVNFLFFFGLGGPKLLKNQNIGGCFVFKLVRGP